MRKKYVVWADGTEIYTKAFVDDMSKAMLRAYFPYLWDAGLCKRRATLATILAAVSLTVNAALTVWLLLR